MKEEDKIPLLNSIQIRHDLRPGDIGLVLHMHGKIYFEENGYGKSFERYVAESLLEFYENYNPQKDRVWICEHSGQIIGTLFLVNRGDAAQLRYFLLGSGYRGIGLGSKLMNEFMESLHSLGYSSCYLWTTEEQTGAIHLYKKHGFVLTVEKESDAFGKRLVELKYELEL